MNCLSIKKQKQILSCYWGGYFKNDKKYPQTLDTIPDFVDIVILAFVGPVKDSTVETTFLCSIYNEDTIKQWIKICQLKGIKVYVSILDTPETHWDKVNLPIFVNSLRKLVIDWNLDGIDIDAESGMNPSNYVDTFINLINEINKQINYLPLTYTCYMGTTGPDGPILKAIRDKIDYIQLMAYFYNFNNMIDLYNDYQKIMNDNIVIGVKAGNPDITQLDEVKKLCLWNRNKKGIMLWTYNRDTPQYTENPLNIWLNTINNNLNKSYLFYIINLLKESYNKILNI